MEPVGTHRGTICLPSSSTGLASAGHTGPSGHPHSCGMERHIMVWMAEHGTGSERQQAHGQSQGRWGCSAWKSRVLHPLSILEGFTLGPAPPSQIRLPRLPWSEAEEGVWHCGHATQPAPKGLGAMPGSCCHPGPVASGGTWKPAPLPSTSWPHRWLCAHDPHVGTCPPVLRVGAQMCPGPARAGRQTVGTAVRDLGQQHLWGVALSAGEHGPACLLGCTKHARSQQGQPGGTNPG